MGLEVATFISGLNANNPVGATDPKSQGDDHLRLIKTTLLNTFPNIAGPVNATQDQINQLISNVPLLDAVNTFTGAAQVFSGVAPEVRYIETDAAANNRIWGTRIQSGKYEILMRNDIGIAVATPLAITRSTGTATLYAMTANSITANGSEVLTEVTGAQLGTSNTFTNGTQIIADSVAQLRMVQTTATADNSTWYSQVSSESYKLGVANDAFNTFNNYFIANRTANTIDSIALVATSITANGSEILTQASNINTEQLLTDFVTDAGTSFTPGSGDQESIRRFTASTTVTVNLNTGIPSGWAVGDSIGFIRGGTGAVNFVGTGTIRSPGTNSISVQHGKVVATLAASGIWELSGNV